jgi:hypothetical protein
MWRERALKIALALVGLLFCAGVYPLIEAPIALTILLPRLGQ